LNSINDNKIHYLDTMGDDINLKANELLNLVNLSLMDAQILTNLNAKKEIELMI